MNPVRPPVRPWKQAIYLWVGIALIPIGIIIAPLPGPGGVPVMAFGALLIITSSRRAASWVRLHRRRWDWMHEILLKGEGWLGGEMGRALRRTNGRPPEPPKPPASRRERILDILLFPVHVAIILTRAVANRFGWKLPGDARKEREAQRKRRRLHRARKRRLQQRRVGAVPGSAGRVGKGRRKDVAGGKKAERAAGERKRGARRRRRNRLPVAASVQGVVEP